jgi:hypothetical protein
MGIQPRINTSTRYIDDDLLETGRESYNQVLQMGKKRRQNMVKGISHAHLEVSKVKDIVFEKREEEDMENTWNRVVHKLNLPREKHFSKDWDTKSIP